MANVKSAGRSTGWPALHRDYMATPKLWTYQAADGWHGHIDWKDGTLARREGPFSTEAHAAVVISRKNGMAPPDDMLVQWNKETGRRDAG